MNGWPGVATAGASDPPGFGRVTQLSIRDLMGFANRAAEARGELTSQPASRLRRKEQPKDRTEGDSQPHMTAQETSGRRLEGQRRGSRELARDRMAKQIVQRHGLTIVQGTCRGAGDRERTEAGHQGGS